MVCRDAPDAIRRRTIDALLVDQMEPAGGAVADHSACRSSPSATPSQSTGIPIAPPPFSPWTYRASRWAAARNAIGYAVSDWLTHPIARVVADYRTQWKLPPLASPDDSFSRLAQICQMPREFDFPRVGLPGHFHYVGPLAPGTAARRWHFHGNGSTGGRSCTLRSVRFRTGASRIPLFRGGLQRTRCAVGDQPRWRLTEAQASSLPGYPLAVPYAPQEELLVARASR